MESAERHSEVRTLYGVYDAHIAKLADITPVKGMIPGCYYPFSTGTTGSVMILGQQMCPPEMHTSSDWSQEMWYMGTSIVIS